MIIWLASYPRSGNTLLRTLLHQCFDIKTYDDETGTRLLDVPKVGALALESDWDNFYTHASLSKTTLKFVKTHKHPRDDRPAIYIYRDGRMALQSYLAFHRSYIENENPKTLLDLIVGDDYYGSWSNHYYVWATRAAPTLFIRFEDLVEAKSCLIQQIGEFLGVAPVNSTWSNPMTQLQQKVPDFFRSGSTSWQPVPEWTKEVSQTFYYLHGALMVDLGYCSKELVDSEIADLSPYVRNVLDVATQLSIRCASLQFHCDERLRVIKQLSKA